MIRAGNLAFFIPGGMVFAFTNECGICLQLRGKILSLDPGSLRHQRCCCIKQLHINGNSENDCLNWLL